MVVPHAEKNIRSYRIPVGLVYGLLLLALFGTFATGNALLRTADLARARGEVTRLSGENLMLAGELGHVQDRLTSLTDEMSGLVAFEEQIRTVADLNPIDEDVRQVGIGGPLVGARANLLGGESRVPESAQGAAETGDEAARLQRQVRLLRESFSEVLETLSDRKEDLGRTPSILPVENCWQTTGFGYRSDPFTGVKTMHYGVDLSARRGEPIMSTADGKVSFAGRRRHLGLVVEIDHGNGVVTRYGHNHRVFVKKGQEVVRGQVIAAVGSSGRSTNPHLHYEVRVNNRAVDPRRYILQG